MIFLPFPYITYTSFNSIVCWKPNIFFLFPNTQFALNPWFFCLSLIWSLLISNPRFVQNPSLREEKFFFVCLFFCFFVFGKYTVRSNPMIFLPFPYIIYTNFKSTVHPNLIIFLLLSNAQFVPTRDFFAFFPIKSLIFSNPRFVQNLSVFFFCQIHSLFQPHDFSVFFLI